MCGRAQLTDGIRFGRLNLPGVPDQGVEAFRRSSHDRGMRILQSGPQRRFDVAHHRRLAMRQSAEGLGDDAAGRWIGLRAQPYQQCT